MSSKKDAAVPSVSLRSELRNEGNKRSKHLGPDMFSFSETIHPEKADLNKPAELRYKFNTG